MTKKADRPTSRADAEALSDIYREREAAAHLRVSVRTLQRLRLEGAGPVFIQITEKRIGYTGEALRAWVASRERTSTADATVRKAA